MTQVSVTFQLDYCLKWIKTNGYKKVLLQFRPEDIEYSGDVSEYLVRQSSSGSQQFDLDVNVTQANTCCLDTMVTQHLSGLEAIIRFGKVCMTKPIVKNDTDHIPTLFIFNQRDEAKQIVDKCFERLHDDLMSKISLDTFKDALILYDTDLLDQAVKLNANLIHGDYPSAVEVARLFVPSEDWFTRDNFNSLVAKEAGDQVRFNQYLIKKPFKRYEYVIYIGNRQSIQLALDGAAKLYKIDCYCELESTLDLQKAEFNTRRLLNKRIALIEQLKDQEELRIGVILTNPLPDVPEVINRLGEYAKQREHTLYFISMIQTIDDCKIGNFDLCDAFVIVNSCNCSTILESLVFNRPIVTEVEFKMACGLAADYGGIHWTSSQSHSEKEDIINRRKVSDVALALVHTRNELLERCSQARANKWAGLNFEASLEDGDNGEEGLEIERGLDGIASGYSSERVIMRPD